MLSLALYTLRLNKSVNCNFVIAVSGLYAYCIIFLNITYFYENCRNSILARSSQTHAHARTVTIGTALRAARRTGTAGQPGLLGTDRQWSAVLGPGAPSAHSRRLCGLWRRRYVAVTAHCSLCIFYGWIDGDSGNIWVEVLSFEF